MLSPIETVKAELIRLEYKTEGSSPLKILADDGKLYVTKTTVAPTPPYVELINEVLCSYLAQSWNLETPPIALVQISQRVADEYQKRHGALSPKHYAGCRFGERIFFGSGLIDCQTEVEQYLVGPHHPAQMQLFHRPLDLLKIGVFDLWVGNHDRKPKNPNILLGGADKQRFTFVPIDHTAAFAHFDNYRDVTDVRLFLEPKNCILSHQFAQGIVKFTTPTEIRALEADILAGMENAANRLDFMFEQVPREWGLSRKAKEHLKQFLTDSVRNKRIASAYLDYLKK
jgi:hypothetical protein